MGSGMARRLLYAGNRLSVVANRHRGAIEQLCQLGAVELSDLQTLGQTSEAVFLCLPNADIVAQVMEELAPYLSQGGLVIDTTTSLPETSREISARLEASAIDFVDAPVTGGPPGAEAGTLTTMLGGDLAACERAQSLIACYSKTVVRFGESGAGNRAKLVHNFITMGQVALLVEAFRRCDNCGIERSAMYEVMSSGGADSATLRKMLPRALQGSYDGHKFSLSNAAKDVDYIARMASAMGEESALIAALQSFFSRELESRSGDSFISTLLEPAHHG